MATPAKELVEDICTRFILTAPAEEHQSFEHLMFLVEEAHWYYEDTVRDKDRHLKSYQLNSFTRMIFEVCPELSAYVGDLEDILRRFRDYKKNVPAMGAIILDKDMERVLLVKGYQSAACWGFPKGKISSTDATPAKCAIREVMEETGFDIEPYLKEEDCISKEVMGKRMKLYIIPGVDHLTTQFFPKCKGEIGAYAWHLVTELPTTYEEDKQLFVSMDGTRHKFFTVWPFVKPLKDWIAKKKAAAKKAGNARAAAAKPAANGAARNAAPANALFKNAVAAATAPGKPDRDGKARSLSPPSGSSSGGSSPKATSLLQQLFGNTQAVPDPAKRVAVNAVALAPQGRTAPPETSPTAPSTPPPMTSSPKVYTAADLEGRIMNSVQAPDASGGAVLSMLQEPSASGQKHGNAPVRPATAGPAMSPSPSSTAVSFWGSFQFDTAAILKSFG